MECVRLGLPADQCGLVHEKGGDPQEGFCKAHADQHPLYNPEEKPIADKTVILDTLPIPSQVDWEDVAKRFKEAQKPGSRSEAPSLKEVVGTLVYMHKLLEMTDRQIASYFGTGPEAIGFLRLLWKLVPAVWEHLDGKLPPVKRLSLSAARIIARLPQSKQMQEASRILQQQKKEANFKLRPHALKFG